MFGGDEPRNRHSSMLRRAMMIICRHKFSAAVSLTFLAIAAACDGGSPSRTPDEFAADSALAADLALANRDTLLVDSIGAYSPLDSANLAALDSADAEDSVVVRDAAPVGRPAQVATPAPATPAPAPPIPATPRPAPRPGPRLTGTRACNSPTLENQSECVRVSLAAADARLNRIYRALMTEMRIHEGVKPGAKDPPSVQRLRVSQRAWLVDRDVECRRRGRGREGALWARSRVRCLGQFSNRRANELADNFSRLTAR